MGLQLVGNVAGSMSLQLAATSSSRQCSHDLPSHLVHGSPDHIPQQPDAV